MDLLQNSRELRECGIRIIELLTNIRLREATLSDKEFEETLDGLVQIVDYASDRVLIWQRLFGTEKNPTKQAQILLKHKDFRSKDKEYINDFLKGNIKFFQDTQDFVRTVNNPTFPYRRFLQQDIELLQAFERFIQLCQTQMQEIKLILTRLNTSIFPSTAEEAERYLSYKNQNPKAFVPKDNP